MIHFFVLYNLIYFIINKTKKGQKFKHWTAEEKYKVIEPALN